MSRTGCCIDITISTKFLALCKEFCRNSEAKPSYLFAQGLQFLLVHKVPYPLHIIPICHNAMLQWVSDFEQAPQFLCPFPNKHVSLKSPGQDPHVLWSADERRKVTFGRIFTGKTSSYGTAAVVKDDGSIMECFGHI